MVLMKLMIVQQVICLIIYTTVLRRTIAHGLILQFLVQLGELMRTGLEAVLPPQIVLQLPQPLLQ